MLTATEKSLVFSAINQVEHTPKQLAGLSEDLIAPVLELIDHAFVYGLSRDMWIGAAFALLGALIIFKGIRHLNAPTAESHSAII